MIFIGDSGNVDEVVNVGLWGVDDHEFVGAGFMEFSTLYYPSPTDTGELTAHIVPCSTGLDI